MTSRRNPRPARRMPTAEQVARYWIDEGKTFGGMNRAGVITFGSGRSDLAPACFRCGEQVPAWNKLDRAHLVDRARDGLDIECNLALLCVQCHRSMPSFEPERAAIAIAYVNYYRWEMDVIDLLSDGDDMTERALVAAKTAIALDNSEDYRRMFYQTMEADGIQVAAAWLIVATAHLV